MPQIDPAAPRLPYKFKGKAVSVPIYFTPGHVLTENEATFGTRQLASVTGNVLASALNRLALSKTDANAKLADTDTAKQKNPDGTPKVFTIEDDVTDDEAQALFDAIYSRYEIGVTAIRDGSTVHDPVTAIANNMAWERIKIALKDRNIKVGSVKAEKKAELVSDLLKRDPSIVEAAKAQVAAAGASALPDDMFAGMETTSGDSQSDTAPGASVEGGSAPDSIVADSGTQPDSGPAAPDTPAPTEVLDPNASPANPGLAGGPATDTGGTPAPDSTTGDDVATSDKNKGKGAFA